MSQPHGPTAFAELNGVLTELVDTARTVLADSFVGAYLQGSFAVGDADMFSDCDFLIPVRRPLTSTQEAGLRALHDDLPQRVGHWNRHLEGSYPLVDELRSLDGMGKEWLYVDHGARGMEWATHCNTEVTRWLLREHGVALAGPPPKSLVDKVPPAVLRARMRETIPAFEAGFASWMTLDIGWGQRYAVTSYCRMLYTLETAEVCSKKASLEWAMQRLDPRWHRLLRQVSADRPRGYNPDDPARPGSLDETRAFARYAADAAADW
jgi:Domain of unknown function (DUF4111)